MKRCLLISYVFPPAGGAGVQRVLKLVKYLGDFGWETVVVTPRNPRTPLRDDSYAADLPPDLKVVRLFTVDAGGAGGGGGKGESASLGGLAARLKEVVAGLLFPDPNVVWVPFAFRGAVAAARKYGASLVLVSGPPFSSFILGASVSRRAGIPLVLDFRDAWSGFFTKGFAAHTGGRLWKGLVSRLEARLVGQAARVVGNTPEMTRMLCATHGGPDEKFVYIPNGYDPQDFDFVDQEEFLELKDDILHLLYTGTVFQSHPLDPLWEALALLTTEQRSRIRVDIVGRVVEGQNAGPNLTGLKVRVLPYEPHAKVVRRMARAKVLVMTMADLPSLGAMVPAKLFEYLAVRRPVLAITPPGAAANIMARTGAGEVIHPADVPGIARVLSAWLENPPLRLPSPPRDFDRREIARKMARVFDQALFQSPGPNQGP